MSDFWQDLQAWTQAQVNARFAALARKRRQTLAADINKLLRDRVAKKLKIKGGKAIAAEFLRTGGRIGSVAKCALSDIVSGWFDYVGVVEGAFSKIFRRNTDNSYGPDWVDTNQVADQIISADSPCNSNITLHDSMVGNKGSQYSGKMREIVQVLGGLNYPIPYNYQWCETHGIFVNQISGKWWIIEIKEASGVRAWQLQTCRNLTDEERDLLGIDLPYIPDVSDLPTTGVELLSASGLADAYTSAFPFYTEHGWAFSYDGSEACLISITWPDTYQVSTVWKLAISADDDGNPVSAELTEVESDYLWIPHAWAPKYPHFTSNGPTLVSYDSAYGESSAPESINAPLDVFYSPGSNVPVIIRNDITQGSTSTESSNWNPAGGTACEGIPLENTPGTFHTGTKSTVLLDTPNIDFDAIGRPITIQQRGSDTYSDKIINVTIEPKAGAAWILGTAGKYWIYDSAVHAESIVYHGGAMETQSYNEVFFKPLLDREIVGLYAQQEKYGQYGQQQNAQIDLLSGGYYGYQGVTENPSYSYPQFGCGSYIALVFAQSGDCETSQNWKYTSLGNVLVRPLASPHELSQTPAFAYITDGCYPGANRPCLWACDIGGSFQPSCSGGFGAATTEKYTGQKTDVYLFDNHNGSWVHVYADEAFDVNDDFTSYIDAEAIATGGAVPFWAHLDVFTGQGMTTRFINQNDPADMYYWGAASTIYPLSENGPSTNVGWVGVPLVP